MKIIHLPEAGASEHEIVASLKYRYRLVICFTGCDMATPGAIVSLETHPEHDWLICWITKPHPRYPTLEWRAGVMPVPQGHSGPWPQEKGWSI